jgi:hypothetical protein
MPTTSRSAAQGDADRLDPRLPRPGGELGGARRPRRSGRRATGERIGACRGCGRIGCSGVHEFRDGFLPYVGSELKDVFEELKEVRPDLVFTHPRPPPGSSPADRFGLAFADIRRAADDGPGQYDRMKLVPYAITSLLHAARPKLRAVPARSTGSMSTTWSTRSSPHPPGPISPREPGRQHGRARHDQAIADRIVGTVGTGVEPEFWALPERDSKSSERRTANG